MGLDLVHLSMMAMASIVSVVSYLQGWMSIDGWTDLAGPDVIKFGIESKHSSPYTSTHGFKAAISLALQDMRRICLDAASSHL